MAYTVIYGGYSDTICKEFRNADPQRNVMGQSTEMSPLVSMLFLIFLNPLYKIFNGNF